MHSFIVSRVSRSIFHCEGGNFTNLKNPTLNISFPRKPVRQINILERLPERTVDRDWSLVRRNSFLDCKCKRNALADTGTLADDLQVRLSGVYIRVVFADIIFALNEIANDFFLVFRTIVYNGRCIHRYCRRC